MANVRNEEGALSHHFREDEFAENPSLVMRRAEQDGSVVITDADGKPRMRISSPGERTLVLD